MVRERGQRGQMERRCGPARRARVRTLRLLRRSIVLAATAFPWTVPAQQAAAAVDTVTVEYRALMTPDATQADVRRRAIEGALAEAVRRVAGVQVQAGTLAVKEEKSGVVRDDFVSVVQLDARGRVVDYATLDEEWVTVRHPELGAQVYLRMRLLASVAHDVGQPDGSFRVALAVNATSLTVRSSRLTRSDELVATVTSTKDAELTLVSVAGDSVTVLFPNEYVTRAALRAGVAFEFPSDEWRHSGLRLRASLPESRSSQREVVMAVATRGNVAPLTGRTALELQRWLASIPLEQRAIATVVVEVRRED